MSGPILIAVPRKAVTITRPPVTELLIQRRRNGLLSSVSLLTAYKLAAAADSVIAPGTQALTSWIQVALVGDFVSPVYGEFSITKKDLSDMHDNFVNGVHPIPPTRLCMDYDHLSAGQPAVAGAAKAAGWFIDLELRANGRELWAQIEWTEAGAAAIAAKEYLFVSPEFHPRFTTPGGDEIGCTLLASAITNRPFLQGMDPLSLSAMAGGIATPKQRGARNLTDFSFDDTRARVCEALEPVLGDPDSGFIGTYWYLVDVFDTYAVYRRDGVLWRVDYAMSDAGDVTFAGDPTEVVVQYTPLGLGAGHGGISMAGIKLRDAQGKEFEVSTEALEALPLVKELRAKIPAAGAVVALADHEKVVADVVTLSTQVKTLTDDIKKRDAAQEVGVLLDAGKILPAQKEHYIELALTNHDMFVKLTGTLPVVSPVKPPRETGSGEGGAMGTDVLAEVARLAAAEQTKDPKLSLQDAQTRVLSTNRELYDRYRAANTVKV